MTAAFHSLMAVVWLRRAAKARATADTIEQSLRDLRLRSPEHVAMARRIADDYAALATRHVLAARV